MNYLTIKNNTSIVIHSIPVLDYEDFRIQAIALVNEEYSHCVSYYGFNNSTVLKFICAIANDSTGDIYLLSYELALHKKHELKAISKDVFAFHIFEREIHENFGIGFIDHPWLKPVRYPHNRAEANNTIANYPFFQITGSEIHEVGVGPIHAGVIEPGHFRFMCNGENVLHLEIQLGFQHRGIESLMIAKTKFSQRHLLAESIAGDTVVGHAYTFARNMEQLAGLEENLRLELVRSIALELERIAVHVGNLSALCLDMAYQLGSSVFGALRTPIINYFQWWCGNRFSRTLIRTGYNPYPLTPALSQRLVAVLDDFEKKFIEMSDEMFNLPSVLGRLERTGIITQEQMDLIGAVGIPARATGIPRDIRTSHPFAYFKHLKYEPVTHPVGDVLSHALIRDQEVKKSIGLIRKFLTILETMPIQEPQQKPDYKNLLLKPNQFSIALTEGWRGEICHTAITDEHGQLQHYKVKDPSMHNWLALALAVRNNEISDFPVCNKTFDLSYCGHDL
jgi:Ni,Fe-hydrogenase III large subunit